MAQRLDEIVVIDIEATCWGGQPPAGQVQEIIEVGVCLLNVATRTLHGKESILVRPTSSEVSAYCTALTTLTGPQVAAGVSYAEACADLATRLGTRERLWASWGDFDRILFERQCLREGIPLPFGPSHLNVKTLFAVTQGLPEEMSMMEALRLAGHPHLGTHHRGHDDAWNIAGLLVVLLAQRPAGAVATGAKDSV